jgi:hypothetical protein
MAAKHKFPGRRVNRNEKSVLRCCATEWTDTAQSIDMQSSDRLMDDVVQKLTEFRSVVGESDEVIGATDMVSAHRGAGCYLPKTKIIY